ncbi:MAG: YihY/virulence factor BrkB family protein [Candidatus Aminicenantes bacterium]|nr:MAG: YihY/virulence factor BrkB family protein [Candidatus Aminicenantes bacterium]
MNFPAFEIVKTTIKRFNEDRCGNFAITISYFAVLCSVPLVALFAFATSKILGNPEIASQSLNIFSEEFFAQLDPYFIKRVEVLSKNITNLGWFGLAGSFIAGSFLFSNLIYSINFIFKANYQKSFFYNRLLEYLIMFTIGIFMLISLFITATWSALHRTIEESPFVANHINPKFVSLIDNFFIQYLIPFTLTFLVFFSLYKLIPEVKVHTRAAVIAAAISTLLWEVFKRIFAFYVAHFSAIGIVLSRLVEGTLTSIIFFLLWLTFSLVILFWGAELTSVLNERIHEKAE